jgi:ferredoxin
MMPQRVKIEGFGGSSPVKKENKPQSPIMGNIDKNTSIKAEAINNGFEVSFTQSNKHAKAAEGESILDVAENLDVDIDSSCRAGSCGSCKVKLLEGQVEMDVDDGLEDDDKENGYVLACQSIPKTPVKVEV